MPLLQRSGKLTFLRVHELGTGYGPNNDFIEGEVVAKIDSEPSVAFGFELRDDSGGPAHQGMLSLLRDAFENGWEVTVDYDLEPGRSNGALIRVALIRTVVEDGSPGIVVGGGVVMSG